MVAGAREGVRAGPREEEGDQQAQRDLVIALVPFSTARCLSLSCRAALVADCGRVEVKTGLSPQPPLGSREMTKLLALAQRLRGWSEDGATMVEYGLMLAFIALVCFSAVQVLGVNVSGLFPSVTASL